MARYMIKLLLILIFSVCPKLVYAHAMAPSLLKISPVAESQLSITWKQPIKQVQGTKLFPSIAGCRHEKTVKEEIQNDAYVQLLLFVCSSPQIDRIVSVKGIKESSTYVLVEWKRGEGDSTLAIIDNRNPEFRLSESEKPFEQFMAQVQSGSLHLLVGYDHVLFILGLLLLLSNSLRNLAIAFTCFTLGHTVSLFLASLRIISVNGALIEVLILVSLVWMALEVLSNNNDSIYTIRSNPFLLTFSFGLIHGFGFSNVLSEYLDASQSIVSQVLAFNIGVEIGQIVVVLIAYPLLKLLQNKQFLSKLNGLIGYSIGGVSVYWMIQMM